MVFDARCFDAEVEERIGFSLQSFVPVHCLSSVLLLKTSMANTGR